MLLIAAAALMAGCNGSETGPDLEDTIFEEEPLSEHEENLSCDTADYWHKYHDMPLDTVLSRLSEMQWLPDVSYGWDDEPIESWGLRIRMDELCDNGRLAELAKSHPAPVSRAMAFDILRSRHYKGCYQLMLECLGDTATIMWGVDVLLSESVASYMMRSMKSIDDGGWHGKRNLTMPPEQQREADSILLARPGMGHIDRLKWILDTLTPDPKLYSRLRAMYIEEGVGEALPALARYRNEQDFALIKEALSHYSDKDESYIIAETGLKAVAEWPDNRFWPTLRRIRNFVVWKHYTDGDYNSTMRECVNAAYHYYSPKALRYIRSFGTLTLGKMDSYFAFGEAYRSGHPEDSSSKVPERYKKYFNKYKNR